MINIIVFNKSLNEALDLREKVQYVLKSGHKIESMICNQANPFLLQDNLYLKTERAQMRFVTYGMNVDVKDGDILINFPKDYNKTLADKNDTRWSDPTDYILEAHGLKKLSFDLGAGGDVTCVCIGKKLADGTVIITETLYDKEAEERLK